MARDIRKTADVFGNSSTAALLAGLTVLCFILVAVRPLLAERTSFLFLLWNLFLAWLPFVVSTAAVWMDTFVTPKKLKPALLVFFGIPWLVLFPNSPYLTTDFIHLVDNKPLYIVNGEITYLAWFDLIVFFLFSWCGLLLGYLSTLQFHRMVARSTGEAAGWLFIAAVSVLGGYGIFLGRVVRLNSWDVLYSPFRLLYGVLENLHLRGILFTCLFALFLFIIYVFLYSLKGRKG